MALALPGIEPKCLYCPAHSLVADRHSYPDVASIYVYKSISTQSHILVFCDHMFELNFQRSIFPPAAASVVALFIYFLLPLMSVFRSLLLNSLLCNRHLTGTFLPVKMPPDLNAFTVFPEKLAVTHLVSKFILLWNPKVCLLSCTMKPVTNTVLGK
jgi:hypothetical protein